MLLPRQPSTAAHASLPPTSTAVPAFLPPTSTAVHASLPPTSTAVYASLPPTSTAVHACGYCSSFRTCCWLCHTAYNLCGVWIPHSIFSTHWAWWWWSKSRLLTLVKYYWAHCGRVWLEQNDSPGRNRPATVNETNWENNKCITTRDIKLIHTLNNNAITQSMNVWDQTVYDKQR